MPFRVLKKSNRFLARRGVLQTAHGEIQTPFFMPIATKGSVKALDSDDIEHLGAEIILANTYHLYLRPGVDVLKKFGGLHAFMNWKGPILTDSGGFQVFSLGARMEEKNGGDSWVRLSEKGVEFRSHLDGAKHSLTPEKAVQIQAAIGSDIMMVLDECPSSMATPEYLKDSLELTTRWAKRSKDEKKKLEKKMPRLKKSLLFAIVQGGTNSKLRAMSVKQLLEIGFDGYALGGLAVGEPVKAMFKTLDATVPLLPENKPRYLMGVGYPEQIVEAVRRGIDMFDCVLPTRNARHGVLFSELKLSKNWKTSYKLVRIKRQAYTKDERSIDANCSCETCKNYSRAYLRHLFSAEEPLALRLATIHNVHFYLDLMRKIRDLIK
ncbi:tRNA guanosine(34) transglycosylase Tgt [Candidatus Kaiserbacteria bacterium RIFCSPHIGHO2_01_FULL_48_10]|uniref:Queuine tRNA-ribosyltransferase n=1 Tax=Candidatus Kaiserbacteria bacterium RIFCSPHIGHO2_01_FULL_48_10 TaxID=1798476 RepID=A0A1F6C1M3_9BACT|nr:MAG: tRNA guanosine(34) transglycosylase Tgt [Candidatus Kaiserbacteria bacterium RIFCSPHIGHO2_01_FULL_48_10]HLC99741.1 tRNA guanosine(34) transglycosylase Tgt [Patescibacteria group bacterium]